MATTSAPATWTTEQYWTSCNVLHSARVQRTVECARGHTSEAPTHKGVLNFLSALDDDAREL